MLINVSDEVDSILAEMMTVFCTAIRFSFKRLLEGAKCGELEKTVAGKYKLNIRQAKDAVEDARQVIVSQKKLVKQNYSNYANKVSKLEDMLLTKELTDRKRKRLLGKLDKRKRKQAYYKGFIDTDAIPPVTFGTKELFIRRCKGLITRQQWRDARNNRIYSRGDRTKTGNPNLRIIANDEGEFLEISTLEKTGANRAVKIQVPLYLPQKLSKKTGNINGRDYRSMVLQYLQTGEAYQVELIKRDGRYYCHVTIDETKIYTNQQHYTAQSNLAGIDTNPDGFALTLISRDGNYAGSAYLKQPDLLYARSGRRSNLCGELAKKAAEYAMQHNCGIAVEDLKFADDTDVKGKFARTAHQFTYRKLLRSLLSACARNGVAIIQVKPQYTSKIGLYKYCHQYGLDVHNGAAMVIARRAYGYRERIPKLLEDKLITSLPVLNRKSEWGKWSVIHKEIQKRTKKEGGTGFWQRDRKNLLSVA